MKTILNIFKSSFGILFGVIISGLIILGIVSFIWGFPGKSYNLTEKYVTIGDYSIGKQQYYYNICNKPDGCFNGEILGLKQIGEDIYIYIKVNYGVIKSINKTNILDYYYNIYSNSERIYIKQILDIPKYGYLSNNKLQFYSENDLKNLPEDQQNIFKELEKKPTVIIDGVDYTK